MNPSDLEDIRSTFPNSIINVAHFRDETTITLSPDCLLEVCQFCKDALGYDYLIDISSVDHFGHEPRFEIVYELCQLENAQNLRLKVKVSEDDPSVNSVTSIWPAANWHEREVFDMMGIRFKNHPDLRRILMWEGYPYHPLRKDFPLEGKPSEVPDVAFTEAAPLAGGPFVSIPTTADTRLREPRARQPGDLPPDPKAIAET